MSEITAVIGAGTMGSRMIEHLVAAGHQVKVHDPDPRAAERATAYGATVFDSPAEAASGSDVCLLSLPTPDVVRVAAGPGTGVLGASPLPRVVADMSTIDPMTTRSMAAEMRQQGVGYLDTPVLGRPDRCGQWTLPVGGEAKDLAAAASTLRVVAANLVHVGPSGTGSAVKLLNNLMFAAINAVTAECLAGARHVGLDPAVFVRTIADSGAASVSNLFREIGPKMVEAEFSPAFTLELLHKDVGLAVSMLEDSGAESVLGPVLNGLSARGLDAGLGALDTSALVRLFEGDGAAPADDAA